MPNSFRLAELIESAANELRIANTKRPSDPVMQFTNCELEVSVTVAKEAGGGFKFWVVDGSGKVSGETVSKIKLTFEAISGSAIVAALADDNTEGPAPPPRRKK
jgi:Trypsin-co-occurring domain 2